MKPRNFHLALSMLVLVALVAPDAPAQIDPLAGSGFEFQEGDRPLLDEALEKQLTDGQIGGIESWNNPESGNHGTMTLQNSYSFESLSCRRIRHDIRIAGKADTFAFVIDYCQTPDGTWKVR